MIREVIAGIVVLVCLFLIPGSAFAYWVPDSYGQGIGPGPGVAGPQGYPGSEKQIYILALSLLILPTSAYAYTPVHEHEYAEPTISQIPGECVPWYIMSGFGDLACGQHYPLSPFHIRMLIANHTSYLASQGYTEVKFRVPANITNVYFSVAAEVLGNNFTGAPGINAQLYDITECHKTITAGDLQRDGRCGISYLDASGMSAMNGSIGHIRLPAGRNYVLVITNPADGPVQVSRSAYITYTYLNSTHGEGK